MEFFFVLEKVKLGRELVLVIIYVGISFLSRFLIYGYFRLRDGFGGDVGFFWNIECLFW